MAFAAPQVPAEEPVLPGELIFTVVGWVFLYAIRFLPFHPCEIPIVYFS